MALDVRGRPILNQGEFVSLMRGLDPRSRGNGVLAAWWAGEPVRPAALYAALDVDARFDVVRPRAHEIIDTALDRLERHFPNEVQ